MPSDTPTNYAGIIIRMNAATDSVLFPSLVKDALAQIYATATGKKLLLGIVSRAASAKFGYTVCIKRADMTYDGTCATKWKGTNVAKRWRRGICYVWRQFGHGGYLQPEHDQYS